MHKYTGWMSRYVDGDTDWGKPGQPADSWYELSHCSTPAKETRGISSSGRAAALQAVGGRFESDILHQFTPFYP